MKLRSFLGDHLIDLLLYVSSYLVVILLLSLFQVNIIILMLVMSIGFLFGTTVFVYEFQRRKRYYCQLFATLDQLDQKNLIHELVPAPSFLDGKLLHQVLYETNKSMNEQMNVSRASMDEFKEYIELWVHEVKLPIAAGQLILHNNPSGVNKKLREQFQRIEDSIQQVLYYARSEHSEKDYLITNCSLDDMVSNVIRRNKDALLYGKMQIDFEPSGLKVYTDSKWMEFIINQVMSNAIKYCNGKQGSIRIWAEESKETRLFIEDNGIGIPASEVPRVFEKSFTGSNGRSLKSSTGMGLFLCDQLCRKLGHSISLCSQENQGTRVTITFARNEFYGVLREE